MTETGAVPDRIAYLDAAAETAVGADYKRRFVAALDLRPGQTVVDLGCGPGTDLPRLADAVGTDGTVLGLDQEPTMIAEARRRLPTVELLLGDVHDLPLADGSVDRARADRVLQHVTDPAKALREARRVLRPGGLFGAVEPDWDTLAIADDDVDAGRRLARLVAGRVRHPTIGRDLPRLCVRAGFDLRSITPTVALFRDFASADQVLRLRRNAARAALDEGWLRRLAEGPVVVAFTFYLVVVAAPIVPFGARVQRTDEAAVAAAKVRHWPSTP